MTFYQLAASACIGLAVAACGGRDDDTTGAGATTPVTVASPLVQLENSGALPRLDRSASLAGPDANNNGVRDDIDDYINTKFTDPKQRAAVLQDARTMQKAVLVDPTNKEASKAVSLEMMAAVNCVSSRFPDGQGLESASAIGAKIEAITTNTKPRLKAYLAFNKSQDGTAISLPTGDTCE
ncbi:hypothetical protein [Actimicrobium antarcticum]|uniref:Lipoprotein n=1 Tax=Actimicrobium antarcticum TaxID=1051899 RepID=A0ABP7TKA7_9BURK